MIVLPELSLIYVVLPIRFIVADEPSFRLMNEVLPIRFTVDEVPSDRFMYVVPPIWLLVDEPDEPLQKLVAPMVLHIVCALAMHDIETMAIVKCFVNFM
jgi:hypothetical protein